jgi:hypothetical protein
LCIEGEILEAHPPRHQHYTALRGIPASHYSGEVGVNTAEMHTELMWTRFFEPRVPGAGQLLSTVFDIAIARIADRAIAQPWTQTGRRAHSLTPQGE